MNDLFLLLPLLVILHTRTVEARHDEWYCILTVISEPDSYHLIILNIISDMVALLSWDGPIGLDCDATIHAHLIGRLLIFLNLDGCGHRHILTLGLIYIRYWLVQMEMRINELLLLQY